MEEKRPSILIVDDTPKNLQVLGNTLKMSDYKVEFAINGFKALEWIGKQSFDLILLDVMMPEMDGYEVCEKIRKDEQYNNLPIIFLTAKTDEESIVHGFKIGAQDYITKPFNTQELLVRVETQLELKMNREKLESVNKWLEDEVKKRTEEIAQANVKLEKANKDLMGLDKAKTDFLTVISNEMRAPLNGILSTMHLLKDQVDSKELVNLISVLDTSVLKLERFSSYALEATALKTNKLELKNTKVNLYSLVEQCVIDLANKQKKQKVAIAYDLDEQIHVEADEKYFGKATRLILSNLLECAAPESEIKVSVANKPEKILIEFSSQGQSFTEDFINHEFEKKDAETNCYNPMGLDFNLVKLIVEAHKGSIFLNNENTGIKFIIELEVN